jgi:hypothetical protein
MVRFAARHLACHLARLALALAFAAVRLAHRIAGAAGLGFSADVEVIVEVPTRRTPAPAPTLLGEPGFPADFFGPEDDGVPEPLISESVVAAYLAGEPAPEAGPG